LKISELKTISLDINEFPELLGVEIPAEKEDIQSKSDVKKTIEQDDK
jgi:hypothetical protein